MKTKKITVLANTRLKDLKVGDLVMTAEVMRVVQIFKPHERWESGGWPLLVTDVKPQCSCCKSSKCGHESFKHLGWGQQGAVKVLKMG